MGEITLGELAQYLGLQLEGDPGIVIRRAASLESAKSGDISFVGSAKHKKALADCEASALIVHQKLGSQFVGNTLISNNPYADFARAVDLITPTEIKSGVHETAVIDPSASLAKGVYVGPNAVVEQGVVVGEKTSIGPNCVIGARSKLGSECSLKANVSVAHDVCIGDRVLVHQGAVIGADGFGLAKDGVAWLKIPQIGRVVIGNDVEIGANTTIDRGALDDTHIADGVKLDNQIQIAHNVHIGAHTAIAACVGIAGSAKIGSNCTIGGAAVVLGHLEIADDVDITAMSLVTKSIEKPGVYSSGTPLQSNAEWHRNYVRFKQLDDMAKRLRALERKVEEYEQGSSR